MKTLYMLIGMPASGKSTWFKNIVADKSSVTYLSTDQYIETYAAVQGKTYNEVFDEYIETATNLMLLESEIASHSENDVYFDQTNLTVKSRKKKLSWFPDHRKVAVVFNSCSPIEYINRLNSRVGKSIPQHVLKSMAASYQKPTLEEGFDQIIYT